MPTEELILVFVKNPHQGKVKTRLAESVGAQKALQIYHQLLRYTCDVVKPLEADVQVWYSDYIPLNDMWDEVGAEKRTQIGETLGQRMKHAFNCGFAGGYQRIGIIGSDCAQLETDHLRQAFRELEGNEVVAGPSRDGGYYLLGMRNYYPELFEDKEWSTSGVYAATVADIDSLDLSFAELPELNDVDTLDDWKEVKYRFVNSRP
ncbi:TIGR04282 family arsenosugar biosynthesis glycosyltransferase [Halalkalibaculum sp. DA3122]|uniref:TIGR04282 family arsenosugar biosynthesis glycosyltransferase n=1 Tax=unclassified Halalkalibaculum TaxID=2964617 RepID=UPI003754B95D